MIIAPMQSLTLPPGSNPWPLRLFTLLLAALATASALFWVLKWPVPPEAPRTSATTSVAPVIDSDKIARLLGASAQVLATPVAVNLQANFKLLGLIARGNGQRGYALIAVEGAAAKPYRVGDKLADGVVLQAVQPRTVVLGPTGQTAGSFTLELPLLPGMTADR